MTIISKVRKTIEDNNLIEKNDIIIIGASGGPDSQFLVYALNALRKDLDFEIILAHLNHLHRKEAIDDENLVRETAEKIGLKFIAKRASMDAYAKKLKISPEDAGRRLRYQFFREIKGSKIAVAHNFDDQAETVLMRVIRGTGIEGLRAMTYKNKDIIRPILDIRKKDLLRYLDEEKIPYHIDITNQQTDYTRNKLRLDLIPQLEKINPNFKQALVNLSHLAFEETKLNDTYINEIYHEYVQKSQDGSLIFDKARLEKVDRAVASRLIRRAILEIKGDLKDISKENMDTFLNLLTLPNGKSIIKDDLIFTKSYKHYRLGKICEKEPMDRIAYLSLGEEISFDGLIFRASKAETYKKKKPKNVEYFDGAKLSFPIKIRYRKNGDSFKPLGMNTSKKIKDFFIDQKVDRYKRDKIPMLLAKDDIIWVVGLRSSEDYKVDPSTRKIIKIEVENGNWL